MKEVAQTLSHRSTSSPMWSSKTRKTQNLCTHLLGHAPLPARLTRLNKVCHATVRHSHLGQLDQQRPRRRGDVAILPGCASALTSVYCLLGHRCAPSLRPLRSRCPQLLRLTRHRRNPSLHSHRSGHTSRRCLVRGRACRVAEDGLGMAAGLQGISAPCPTGDVMMGMVTHTWLCATP